MMHTLYRIFEPWIDFVEAMRRRLSPPPKLSEEERRERRETIAAFVANAEKNRTYTPEEWRAEFVAPLFEAHGEAVAKKAYANAKKMKKHPPFGVR